MVRHRCPRLFPLVVFLIFVSGFVGPFEAFGQNTPDRQITLIHPNDPEFEPLLNSNFPGLEGLDGFAVFRPYLVLLRNDGQYSARAYTVVWDITFPRGMVSHLEDEYVQRHQAPKDRLEPFSPGDIRLVSPAMDLGPADFKIRRAGIATTLPELVVHPPYSSPNVKSLSVSMDAVIYDDGQYAGPDNYLLLTKYQCIREAERGLAKSLLQLMDTNAAGDAVVGLLTSDVRAGLAANTSRRDTTSICALYRGEEAQALLLLYRSGGMEALMSRAWALEQRRQEKIVRISPPQ
jgi:hypothetical protein